MKVIIISIVLFVVGWFFFKDSLIVRQIEGNLSILTAPGYSGCNRCNMRWKFVEFHTTDYSHSRGCFPLCERCWQELETPGKRLPYYRQLWEEWGEWAELDPKKWEQIKLAVMEGK